MTDDTSYYISFDSYDYAYVAMLLLNSKKVVDFLLSITFTDAKRPFTKKVLDRIDFNKICNIITFEDLQKTENMLSLDKKITNSMYSNFMTLINNDLFTYKQNSSIK